MQNGILQFTAKLSILQLFETYYSIGGGFGLRKSVLLQEKN
jgi:hypothetical protein